MTERDDPLAFEVQQQAGESATQSIGRHLPDPAVNAVLTMQSFQGFVGLGEDIDVMATLKVLRETTDRVKAADLSDLEAMLIAQATALQTMFASLARRSQGMKQLRNVEAMLGLALKAQAQSRATISALVDLKFPRQVAFVKQANIATNGGQQQVNNGTAPAHGAIPSTQQNGLLEACGNEQIGSWLDTGAQGAAGAADPHLAAVGEGHGPAHRRRKSARIA